MSIGLLFSGQGAQRVGMGRSLCQNSPSARGLYETANELLGYDFAKLCFEGPLEGLTPTEVCQPALYVHGLASFAVWEEWGGEECTALAMGLSLGEITALAAADVFGFEVGLKIVAERGRLMQVACEQADGTMASVLGGERDEVAALAAEFEVDLANLNSPGQVVISGPSANMEQAIRAGRGRGFKRILPLKVAGAYHSRLMEPARAAFEEFLAPIDFRPPRMPVYSNVDASATRDPAAIKAKLVKQIVSPVYWEDCMLAAKEAGVVKFRECGVGGVLKGLARRIDPGLEVISLGEFADF